MSPLAFSDVEMESKYRRFVTDTIVDRSRPYMGLHLLCLVALTVTVAYSAITFDLMEKGDYTWVAVIIARSSGTIFTAFIYFYKWSETAKPRIGRSFSWVCRFFFLIIGAIELGLLKQPDSQLKTGLLWYFYGGAVFITTFEEYVCCSLILAYLELVRLIIWGSAIPCPVDSSRPCTVDELWQHFGYHTLYVGVAIWIHSYTHSDRRRDFVRIHGGRVRSAAPGWVFPATAITEQR
jgi:hypothetical protein